MQREQKIGKNTMKYISNNQEYDLKITEKHVMPMYGRRAETQENVWTRRGEADQCRRWQRQVGGHRRWRKEVSVVTTSWRRCGVGRRSWWYDEDQHEETRKTSVVSAAGSQGAVESLPKREARTERRMPRR